MRDASLMEMAEAVDTLASRLNLTYKDFNVYIHGDICIPVLMVTTSKYDRGVFLEVLSRPGREHTKQRNGRWTTTVKITSGRTVETQVSVPDWFEPIPTCTECGQVKR